MWNFIKRLIPFAALIAIILFIIGFMKGFDTVMTFVWICYAVFLGLSIITFYFSIKTMEKKFSSFMNIFFIGIFSKLVITAIIVLIYKSQSEAADVNFIIPFAIIYFSFLFFETYELVKLSRRIGNNTKEDKPVSK